MWWQGQYQYLVNDSILTFVFASVSFEYFSTVSILRSLLFLRNVDFLVPKLQFAYLIRIIKRIVASIGSLVVSFACIMYLFALVGVWLYGGLVNKDKQGEQYHVSVELNI